MQNERSQKRGASAHHAHPVRQGEVLAPAAATRPAWTAEFQYVIRARAALVGLFDDTSIARAIGRRRETVAGWWKGARPDPDTLAELADALGLSRAELFGWVYLGGPQPAITPSNQEQEAAVREARLWADNESRRRAAQSSSGKGR